MKQVISFKHLSTLLTGLCLTVAAWAQNVTVSDAWARATVTGQQATGVFMKITAKEGAKLVDVSSPVAGIAEIHQMKMESGVMKMSAVNVLDLPAGKTVELKPGGYHVMLMDLKSPLAKDSAVALTLTVQDAKGAKSQVEVSVPVGTRAGMGHDHGSQGHGSRH